MLKFHPLTRIIEQMIILVLSRDKISQQMFRSSIKGVEHFGVVGTNANQDTVALNERLAFVNSNKAQKPFAIFHALKRTIFATPPEWNPEVGGDYPRDLHDIADVVIYTPSLLHTTHGRLPTLLKGDGNTLQSILLPEVGFETLEKKV